LSGVSRGCLGCILCQKRLRLSWKVDECKPLPTDRLRLSAGAADAGRVRPVRSAGPDPCAATAYGHPDNARHLMCCYPTQETRV